MARQAVFEYVTDYFQRVLEPNFKAFYSYKSKIWQMENILPEKPGSIEELLRHFKEKIELNGMHDGSSQLLAGFNPNSANYPSALGSLYMMLADIHNNPEWREVDQIIMKWLLDIVGYSDKANGFMTSGGTSSSVIAMMAAREGSGRKVADLDGAVVYLADTVHNCADKALKAVGLSHIVFREVQYDSQRKLVLVDLEDKIQRDIKNGLLPFMVIGTLGEVDSGAVDPLEGIADIAAKYGLWFHVDAAYGGFFLMFDQFKEIARGVDQADSIIVNFHKGMFQPFGSSAVLFKQGAPRGLFADDPNQKTKPLRGNPIEDSSPFRTFPIWMFLNTLGLKHVRAVTLEKVKLTQVLYSYLTQCPGISVPVKPELSKLLFAMDDANVEEANRKTEVLCKELTKSEHIVVDTTKVEGRVYIHMCISAFRTHIRDVLNFLEKLKGVVTSTFGLPAPDLEEVTQQTPELVNELDCLEKAYLTIEKDFGRIESPLMVAAAANISGQNWNKNGSIQNNIAPPLSTDDKYVKSNGYRTATRSSLALSEEPKSLEESLRRLSSMRQSSPKTDGSAEGGLLEPGILGHFLMASTNRFSGQWVSSPGHIELEAAIPDWLITVTGFPDSAKGVLYNDSCSADFLCLFTARCTKLPDPTMYERAVVYGSASSLQAIAQPLLVLGLADCKKTEIQSDNGELAIISLMKNIQEDLQGGRRTPFLVVLSITPHGPEASNDGLQTLMAFCQKFGIWVHIHVSDGAPFLLADLGPCPTMIHSGLSEADSISVNLTECLCQPQEVAAVLVRDHKLLLRSLQPQREANYFRDIKTVEYEPAAYSLELTRPSRAVAVWFAMYLHGAEKLCQHIAKLRNKLTKP